MNALKQVRKLASMPVAEVAGRFSIEVSLAAERLQHATVGLNGIGRFHAALQAVAPSDLDWREALLAHRRVKRPNFFKGPEHRSAMQALFTSRYAVEFRQAEVWADRALRHEVHFFGETFVFGDRIPWHEDPVSHRAWPRLYHQDIKVNNDDNSYGDVKYVWELSRHQFILDLGKLYFLTGRGAYAAEARRLVVDWLDENPYGVGVNWASPLEPAYRTLAWLWAYWFTIEDPAFDPVSHARWAKGFFDAGRFLHKHLELYTSPYNHLLGEACALYAIGVSFPEFRQARAWRRRARQVLIDRLPQQFYVDGGSVEQATCYHHASLGFYLLAALLGRANGDEFPPEVWCAIERGIEFSVALMQPDGTVPAIGDTDDARPLQVERRPLWDYRAFPAIGAVIFDRGDFKAAAGGFHEDALWLLGPEALALFDEIPASSPPPSVALRASGYATMRSDCSPAADYVCFDCGEQAGGLSVNDVPSAAHGHADCLSVVAWLGGRPVLVDSGFFTYNSDREWERYFRETAAHNTVRVDRRDQAVHLEKMAWTQVPRATLDLWRVQDSGTVATGSHDGYARGSGAIVHRRTVWLRPGGYILIHDELTGEGSHLVELNFQLPPGKATLVGQSVTLSGDLELRVLASERLEPSLACGGPGPGDGWVASGLGVRQPAPRASFVGSFHAPGLSTLSIAADLKRVRCAEVTGGALAAVVTGPDFTDIVYAPVKKGPASIGTDARLAVWRRRDEHWVDAARVGGSFMQSDPTVLFELANAHGK